MTAIDPTKDILRQIAGHLVSEALRMAETFELDNHETDTLVLITARQMLENTAALSECAEVFVDENGERI